MSDLELHVLDYSAKEIAEKDPFDISKTKSLTYCSLAKKYTGIITGFLQKMIEDMENFDRTALQNLGSVISEYFFKGDEKPRAKQWTAFYDEPSGRLKRGDVRFTTFDTNLYDKIKKFFDIFHEIAKHDYEDKDENEIVDSDLYFDYPGKNFKFRYYKPKDGKSYFVFDYSNPGVNEHHRVVKSLR